jgi:hypothetical protein
MGTEKHLFGIINPKATGELELWKQEKDIANSFDDLIMILRWLATLASGEKY